MNPERSSPDSTKPVRSALGRWWIAIAVLCTAIVLVAVWSTGAFGLATVPPALGGKLELSGCSLSVVWTGPTVQGPAPVEGATCGPYGSPLRPASIAVIVASFVFNGCVDHEGTQYCAPAFTIESATAQSPFAVAYTVPGLPAFYNATGSLPERTVTLSVGVQLPYDSGVRALDLQLTVS
jgi:hypothetical protein